MNVLPLAFNNVRPPFEAMLKPEIEELPVFVVYEYCVAKFGLLVFAIQHADLPKSSKDPVTTLRTPLGETEYDETALARTSETMRCPALSKAKPKGPIPLEFCSMGPVASPFAATV